MQKPRRSSLASGIVLATLVLVQATPAQDGDERFARGIHPVLTRYCVTCHATAKPKGDLDLEQFASFAAMRARPDVWQLVFEHVRSGDMPPADKPQPSASERAQLLDEVDAVLAELARVDAGDPGPVVLRRLSNAEYGFTVRDLTGVDTLDPAREFPVDGAAGEGFANVGNALVVSPALLTKYFDAAKAIAEHAVLLPDGIRFAAGTTRRDWTEELLASIRSLHQQFTDSSEGNQVDLQGIVFATNGGGRLPLARYLEVALACRDAGATADLDRLAAAAGLSAKYLRILRRELAAEDALPPLAPIGAWFRRARAADVAPLVAAIEAWQRALWQFRSVGHIGKAGGPKSWMEPVDPLVTSHELRGAVPTAGDGTTSTMYLVVREVGAGTTPTGVVWQQPRLRSPGRPDLLLRDVPIAAKGIAMRRTRFLDHAAACLAAAEVVQQAAGTIDVAALAARHSLPADALAAWLEVLGIAARQPVPIATLLTDRLDTGLGATSARGWGRSETPSLVANASDQTLRLPGKLSPHSVAMHPSPTQRVAVGWRCPTAATVRVTATIEHAHHDCGNGVAWAIELRRGSTRQRLASGVAHRTQLGTPPPIEDLVVGEGDLISVLVGARDGDHTCDLTAVDFTIATTTAGGPRWNLATDVAADVQASNPHADRHGHAAVWHFYSEPDAEHGAVPRAIPPGSLLAQWLTAAPGEPRRQLADRIQHLLTANEAPDTAADAELRHHLRAPHGVLLGGFAIADALALGASTTVGSTRPDPATFGKDGDGNAIDAASLWVRAPSVLPLELPAELAAGCELWTTGTLDGRSADPGCVQLQLRTTPPEPSASGATGTLSPGEPVVATAGSAAWQRVAAAFTSFRRVFPAALCYAKIVPVDETVTLTLFHREDEPLRRLVLDDEQTRRLDQLWDELHFVSQDALASVDAFEQLWQFATQDADPKVFEPLREPIRERAAAFRRQQTAAEPRHLEAVLTFASRAWRRRATDAELDSLRTLYRHLRDEGLAHDESIRALLARVLVAPAFLYHVESPGPGSATAPVGDDELASRLSFFLTCSLPDDELRGHASAGRLRDPDVLAAEARRLLAGDRARRLAGEFGLAWLHLADFADSAEKSERLFPTFRSLRGAMHEEVLRFFSDLLWRDGSVLDLLAADHTFVDGALAAHYGMPEVVGTQWRRVDGMRARGRGGLLGMAAVLAAQSGASRTSPILRGNWVSEVLLGERLPRPPKDVPRLPEAEVDQQLSMRELTVRHSSDARCAHCHVRIDGFGFALESFDAIGRWRARDAGDRAIDTRGTAMDGSAFTGLAGLRDHLLTTRRDAFLRQFLRKLLGYALGRAVLLSDRPLLDDVLAAWPAHGYRIGFAVESIVRSRQFREIRGREAKTKD